MPLGEFLGDISAGYNPAYIFAIENEFGGPDGFRAFVRAAHQRAIAVIVDVVVVLNFGNRGYANLSIGFPRSGMWRVRFNSDWSGYDEFFGNWFSYDTQAGEPGIAPLPFSANVGIGPYSALILSQD
jgi:glycosidase